MVGKEHIMLLFLPTEPVLEIFFLHGDGLHGVVGLGFLHIPLRGEFANLIGHTGYGAVSLFQPGFKGCNLFTHIVKKLGIVWRIGVLAFTSQIVADEKHDYRRHYCYYQICLHHYLSFT